MEGKSVHKFSNGLYAKSQLVVVVMLLLVPSSIITGEPAAKAKHRQVNSVHEVCIT